MELSLYQILTLSGLAFETVSVLVTISKLFYGYHKRLEKGTFREEIRKDRIEGALVLLSLVTGMILQGTAIFV